MLNRPVGTESSNGVGVGGQRALRAGRPRSPALTSFRTARQPLLTLAAHAPLADDETRDGGLLRSGRLPGPAHLRVQPHKAAAPLRNDRHGRALWRRHKERAMGCSNFLFLPLRFPEARGGDRCVMFARETSRRGDGWGGANPWRSDLALGAAGLRIGR